MAGFVKAVKGLKPLRLVIGGPSGSGKSYTALTFAKYLETKTNKPTAAIDTEHGRLSLYADKFNFDVIEVDPPFNPRKLIELIKSAEAGGYGQLIVDSSTHYWSGSGGILEIVNDAARSKFGGNVYSGWAVGTPIQNEVVDTIIRSPLHVIFTTRAKQGYAEEEKNGKKTYVKVGMEMEQRAGFEYDFDFALIMDMDNNGLVTKGMGSVPPGTYFKQPDFSAISEIMKSIQENSEVVEKRVQKEEKSKSDLVAEIKGLLPKASEEGKKELRAKMLELFKEFHPTGNPANISDVETLETLLARINQLTEGE